MHHDDVVIVGSLGGPFGVRGWVHVKSFTQPAQNLMRYRPWLVQSRAGWQLRDPTQVKAHGKGLVACFAGISDRDAAATLTGAEVGVARQVLPELNAGEYYWRDLEGLAVVDQAGVQLGKVSRLMDIGPHVVLVVSDGNGETLIPFVSRHVLRVDLAGSCVEVDWDEPE